ncbi:hypothetical protein Csa_008271, partial [Cucumis sativus]
ELSAPLPKMAEGVLVGTFTNGLDPIIRMEVFAIRAVGLEDMMYATRLAEEKLEMAWASQGPYAKDGKPAQKQEEKLLENSTTKIVTLADRVHAHSSTPITSQVVASGSGVRHENNFRRWTDFELQARCDKGLCYRCDEPFSKGQRCKNKELRLYLVANDLEDTKMEDVENENAMVE